MSETSSNIYPVIGKIYTFEEIEGLYLKDSPNLAIEFKNGKYGVIQSYLRSDTFTLLPGLSDTKWKYRCETREWIPVFDYEGDVFDLIPFLNTEPMYDSISETFSSVYLWITFKTDQDQREQYGLREALKKGVFIPSGVWLDPDWSKKHCNKCERALKLEDEPLTEYNRESVSFNGTCAMCKAEIGNKEAIELQKESIFSNNCFSNRYIKS